MAPQKHPAVTKYLAALKAALDERPGAAAAEALADAGEFLESEWASLRRQAHFFSNDALYQHFVRKLGAPRAMAVEYGGDATLTADSSAYAPHETPVRRRSTQARRYALLAVPFVVATAAVFLLRGEATSAAAPKFTTVGSVAGASPFPFPNVHWADRVVSFVRGKPGSEGKAYPDGVLNAPDCFNHEAQPERVACLGSGGEIVIEFVDRRLIDAPGNDLLVIELGYMEPVFVAVSEDGQRWLEVGTTGGSLGKVDLAAFDAAGREFRFVRVRDARCSKVHATGRAGADVDAIGAIHTVRAK